MKLNMMTKLALSAAVVCAAAGARAETLKWSIGAVSGSESNPITPTSQYISYLFYDTTTYCQQALSGTRTTVSEIMDFLAKGDYTTVEKYAAASSKSSYSSDGTVSFALTQFDQLGINAIPKVFSFIFDAGTISESKNYMVAQKDGANVIGTGALRGYTSYIEQYNFGSQSGNTWLTIPEPTSGLMLLVGVAALALKRKKAA